jgi:hypothetical protein
MINVKFKVITLFLRMFLLSLALQPSAGYGRSRCFLITYNDAPLSVGLIWTSDQLVAEISTCEYTTQKHPCPRWDKNPLSMP